MTIRLHEEGGHNNLAAFLASPKAQCRSILSSARNRIVITKNLPTGDRAVAQLGSPQASLPLEAAVSA